MDKVNDACRLISGFVELIVGEKVKIQWGDFAGIQSDKTICLPKPKAGDQKEIAMLTRLAVHETGHYKFTDVTVCNRLTDGVLRMFNLLDDPRVENKQMQEYPGAAVILDRGVEETLERIVQSLNVDDAIGMARVVDFTILMRGFNAIAQKSAVKKYLPVIEELAAKILSPKENDIINQAIEDLKTADASADVESIATRLHEQLMAKEQPESEDESQSEDGSADSQEPEGGAENSEPQADTKSSAGECKDDPCQAGDENTQQTGDAGSAPNGDDSQGGSTPGDAGSAPNGDDSQGGSTPGDAGSAPNGDDSQGGSTPGDAGSAPNGDDSQGETTPGDAGSAPNGDDSQGGSTPGDAGSAPNGDDSQGETTPGDAGSAPNGDDSQGGSTPGDAGATPNDNDSQDGDSSGEANNDGETSGDSSSDSTLPGDEKSTGTEGTHCGTDWKKEFATGQGSDFGDMIRMAHRMEYGEPDPDAGPVDDGCDAITKYALRKLLETEGQSAEEAIEKAMVMLEQESDERETNAESFSVVPAHSPPVEPVDLGEFKLAGIQSHLVQVLRRELQDQRKRPARTARHGESIKTEKFWRLGRLGDTSVFRAKQKRVGIDAAITLVLDKSVSMDTGTTFVKAVQATVALSMALERLGHIKTSIAAFPSGYGFELVETVQSFGQSVRSCKEKIESLVANGGSTPLGAAMKKTLPVLMQQKQLKHMMIVITDGQPDSLTDVQQALVMAEEGGVDVFGVGIGLDISACIPNAFAIACIEDLPKMLEQHFARKLTKFLGA